MKKLKIFVAVLLSFVLAFSFSGCTTKLQPFEKLLRPPKMTGKYQVLQDTFEEYAGKNYTLVTPEKGEYQSAFVIKDIDGDEADEALVFYTEKDSPEKVKFCYFEYEDEKWIPVSKNDGLGNSIDKVYIADLNNDKNNELVIGWGFFDSKINKTFSVYILQQNELKSISAYPYTYLNIVDLIGNGVSEIFTLYSKSGADEPSTAYARAYSLNAKTNEVDLFSETQIDGNVSAYDLVSVEKLNGLNYIYIDGYKGLDEMITEVVYWDEEKASLVSPLFETETLSTKQTIRHTGMNCTDIDGDKYLEIPVSVDMNGSLVTVSDDNNELLEKPIYFTKWVKFRSNKLQSVQYSIVNESDSYIINIPSSWVGRITVKGAQGQWDIYRWDSSSSSYGDLLFSIYAYPKTDTEAQKKFGAYKALKNYNNKSYVYNITEAGYKFGVKDDIIESNVNIGFFNN